MGLFSSRNRRNAAQQARPAQVRRLLKLGMEETDAAERDIDSPEFERAKARLDAACRDSSQAEMREAFDALRRHGY